MRVSDQMRVRLAFRGLGAPRIKLGNVQEQVTSGRTINRPSDAPSDAARVLDLRESIAYAQQYQNNASKGRTLLGSAESALTAMEDIFSRMASLGVQMSNATVSAEDRDAAAEEVRGAKQHLLDLMNTEAGDVFVFGGFGTQFQGAPPLPQEPWQVVREPNPPPAPQDPTDDPNNATYHGTRDVIEYDMGDGVRLPVTTDAVTAFEGLWGKLHAFQEALKADDVDAIELSIDEMHAARDQVDRARTDIGVKLNRISFAQDVLDRRDIDLKAQLSDAEDADMLTVMATFRQEEIALQAALQMASRIFEPSLMDFLR